MTNPLDLPQALEIMENIPLGILVLDNQQKVLWTNKVLCNFLDVDNDAIVGHTIDDITQANLEAVLNSNDILSLPETSTEEARTIKCFNQPLTSGINAYFFFDTSENEKLRKEVTALQKDLDEKNTRDALTGLLNQRGLHQVLETQLTRSRRYNNPLSVIRMDIVKYRDETKKEKILATIGHMLNDQLRWADMAGRLDDDQFLFVLPETSKEEAAKLANKLSSQLCNLYLDIKGQTSSVDVCFGITNWNKGDDTGKLLRRAEGVLATVKNSEDHVLAV
ncbi:MAG: diguanylate cyclase domain-containing protein [Gammaproteobacteria bacterium]